MSSLECGVDGNVYDIQDMYETILLHSASYQGTPEMVGTLLNGVKLHAKNHWGETAIHIVSRGRQDSQSGVRIAKLLLESGVDVNSQRGGGVTALDVACHSAKLEIVRLLLDQGADVNADKCGLKALHQVSFGLYESREDGVRIAELLLAHGTEVDTRSRSHWTPLHVASRFGKIEIARLLLDRGATVNAEDNDGEKPLHWVLYREYNSQEEGVRVAQLLLERGADVNTRRKDHLTPLHLAAKFGNLEIVRLLLGHGADPEANAEGNGEKPLHKVSYGKYGSRDQDNTWDNMMCHMSVAEPLLEHGADVNTRRNDHLTPLHLATKFGSQEDNRVSVAELLLKRGADVNTRRDDGRTPLHFASLFGNFEIVQLFIDHRAEVDPVDDLGKTPLHDVSRGKYESQEDGVRVAQLLLDHGADVNAKSKAGHTPLALAIQSEKPKLAELFLEHTANVNAQRPSDQVGHGRRRSCEFSSAISSNP